MLESVIKDTNVPIHEINDNNTINNDIKKWEEGHKKPKEKTVIPMIEFMKNHGVKADNSPFVHALLRESKKNYLGQIKRERILPWKTMIYHEL